MPAQRQSSACKREFGFVTGGGGGGTVTGGANVGGAAGRVFRDLTGSTLNFRTIAAGSGTTVSTVGDTVVIDQNENIDGGAPGDVYLPSQHIDGGGP
jgi:hypothetical protein